MNNNCVFQSAIVDINNYSQCLYDELLVLNTTQVGDITDDFDDLYEKLHMVNNSFRRLILKVNKITNNKSEIVDDMKKEMKTETRVQEIVMPYLALACSSVELPKNND